jgi:glutamate/tyrosine decarboxylase-like PLP-dependent enzyme
MENRLDLTDAETRALGNAAVEWMAEYYRTLRERRIMPDTTSAAIRELIEEPLPQSGTEAGRLLEILQSTIARLSRHNGHPRMFGYVASPGAALTAIGDMFASTLNANVTSWRSAPAPTEIEHVAINWIKEILGYPKDAAGLFVSGGSLANFAALAAARSFKAPGVIATGMDGHRRLRVYVSEEGHFSIAKAAGLLGIGQANVQAVRTDARFRIDLAELERCVEKDLTAGYVPACVVATAGSVNTGAFDPLEELAGFAERHELWLHVDGAYGGFAALAPSAAHFFQGIGEADSVALDPHKWLFLPVSCGCVLYRDADAARRTFGHDADYTRPVGLEAEEAFAFWNFGPELSRRFRALNVWLLIKYAGVRALAEAVEHNMACARYFEEMVRASTDFQMLAPVTLSIFCFRYAPKGFTGDLDALNERILVELHRAGHSYVSNTRLRGRFALRGCVLNHRTIEQDMEILLEDLRQAAHRALALDGEGHPLPAGS